MRRVVGLRWAKPLDGKPSFLPCTRAARGVRGEGLRYEKALARGLGARFQHGLWWEYRDECGICYCQTDFFGKSSEWAIVLESKLTWTQDAETQLWELYVPVVACALGFKRDRVVPIVVCKYLTKESVRPIGASLKETVQLGREVSFPFCAVWHHLGGVPRLMEAA